MALRTRLIGTLSGALALTAVGIGAGDAQADTTTYFSTGPFNCSIDDSGRVGCDLTSPTTMYIKAADGSTTTVEQVREVVVDDPNTPAHPGPGDGTPNTLPGGNPSITQVGHPVGSGAESGSEVSRGGSYCKTGFHAAVYCANGAHGFSYYEAVNAY
ncbi:hypothetical protein [Williamsia sterculiae]|uniref:Uncharacterized protein n=1 Tax=Williamsia sterculiae TaxID=1344003 RepID=A0A1N7FGN2_9NOCA|nr:hypothetical protein [Williamsia sterculiae]SIR99444.1 hypothetical protein SAMN05445060_2049 [Williamsia sterculiae]